MKFSPSFILGAKAMLPITMGVIPFAAVIGGICSDAQVGLVGTMTTNLLVYAGASQLAATELMVQRAAILVVVASGLMINLRFLLYSAAMAPIVRNASLFTKALTAYMLTDQAYAAMSAHQDQLKTDSETLEFYFGASLVMSIVWHSAVFGGFIFGNFAPPSWSLDYAVPLSFVALVIPTIKNRTYLAVVLFSSVVSLLLNPLPYRLSLVVTAVLGISLGAWISNRKAGRA